MNKTIWLCPQCADLFKGAFEVRRIDGKMVYRRCDECKKKRFVSRVRVSNRRR